MIDLSERDVVPLDTFSLAYRWTQPEHQVLPPKVLAAIRALSSEKALEFANDAVARAAPRPVSEWDFTISADWDDPAVRVRLGEILIGRDTPVILSWDQTTAVATTWGIFLKHWNAFCYASSDDVTVWSPGQPWTLVYRHFRVIEFQSRPLLPNYGCCRRGVVMRDCLRSPSSRTSINGCGRGAAQQNLSR